METIKAFREAYLTGKLSPVEVLRARIPHISGWQQQTRLLVDYDVEKALSEARESEERYRKKRPRGPLDGILVGLKDLIDVKGEVTTAGSKKLLGHRAHSDAAVVTALRDSGANISLGKLNLHEFAYGPTSASSYFGAVSNPFDGRRMAGGSSGGSAVAVAVGLMSAALGTDTGGSVRIPAALCGVSGLKPTYGRISVDGVIPLSWSLDHVGPLARSVADVAEVWQVLSGDAPPCEPARRPLRLYWPQGPEVACYDRVLDQRISESVHNLANIVDGELHSGPLMDLDRIWLAQSIIIGSEALSYHWPWVSREPQQYQPDVAERLVAGGSHLAVEYLAALRFRQSIGARYDAWLESYDAIVMPTVPILPPLLGDTLICPPQGPEEDVRATLTRFTSPFNLLGLPALSIPLGLSSEGLPLGLQIVGRRGAERELLWIGQRYQEQFPESMPIPPDGLL